MNAAWKSQAAFREAQNAVRFIAVGALRHVGRGSQEKDNETARFLIIVGLVLVAAGLLWPLLQKVGLGRLPGDIVIERESFRLYLPLGTSLLISLVLSVVLWLFGR